MKKITLLFFFLIFEVGFAQKVVKIEKIKDKYNVNKSQDFSVPPPPMTTFPAQFPRGNKVFIEEVKKNLDKEKLKSLSKDLMSKIILKIDSDGNVINISTFGNNDDFNIEVKNSVEKTTNKIIWIAGENNRGEKVIDIVKLPFKYSNLQKK